LFPVTQLHLQESDDFDGGANGFEEVAGAGAGGDHAITVNGIQLQVQGGGVCL
jgi:hypothetical protein